MPPKAQIREVDGIKYKLTIKDVMELHLRVDKDGNISVSANKYYSLQEIDKFVSSNADKIKKYIDKMAVQSERCLFPPVISDGSEFYFLGEKRRISLTGKPDSALVGDTLYLSKTAEKTLEIAFMELLDTRQHKNLLGTFVADMVLQILGFVAESERENIRQRQAEGIAAAKARGVKFGRPKKFIADNYIEIHKLYRQKKISKKEAKQRIGCGESTFFKPYV